MKEQILANKINVILSEWDPIGLGKPISGGEYQGYIPEIISVMDNRGNLEKSLIHILDQLGMSYDTNSKIFHDDIASVAERIFALK